MSKNNIEIPQYSKAMILKVWLLATAPMAILSWVIAPWLANMFSDGAALVKALIICLTTGLVWQFVLVLLLVKKEQGNIHWATLKKSLWLNTPINPKTKKPNSKLWWITLLFILAFAIESALPTPSVPAARDLGVFLSSDTGKEFFHHAWGWYSLFLFMALFNTVFGEELLFRGLLLPRMNKAFKSKDWLANGILFGFYHLHVPWSIPAALLDSFVLSYPTKRYKSAWIGIIVHSTQSIFFGIILLMLVV